MVQLNRHDLDFILKQIKIAEANSMAHSGAFAGELKEIWVDEGGNAFTLDAQGFPIDSAGQRIFVGGIAQTVTNLGLTQAMSAPHVPYGLRTVDGSNNNLIEGRDSWGASNEAFLSLLTKSYRPADGDVFASPGGPALPSGYSPMGSVADADPRMISNLIVDQTLANPAAIYTALLANGYAGNALTAAQTIHAQFTAALTTALANSANATKSPAVVAAEVAESLASGLTTSYGLVFDGPTLQIENVAPDEGLSASYNSWFTLFGQFFDHGLDLVNKERNGTIFIPLSPDDPLYQPGSQTNFMTLTRSPTNAVNLTTPFVDQNQTYASTASKQLFLREYVLVDGKPVATGHLLEGADGIATWAEVKKQAHDILGIDLTDASVGAVPKFLMDDYGEFIRGTNGFPQLVTTGGPVEGNLTAPIPVVGTTVLLTGHAFLDDIAHDAVPVIVNNQLVKDGDSAVGYRNADGSAGLRDQQGRLLAYDNEGLDAHFVTGDGRGNENIGLTAVHHVFHSEHNRTVDDIQAKAIAAAQGGDFAFLNEWLSTDVTVLPANLADLRWDGERLFQAARFTTEMQYQHLVFEEFARKIQPDVDAFVFNPSMDINPAIFAEFAHVVYRFGHSMLNETVDRVDGNGTSQSMDLFDAFLNPTAFAPGGVTAEQGAGAIIRGMTGQTGNEIDEFVTNVLRNHLVGIPLDLAALNIARGRETGIPGLNEARAQFKVIANNDTQLDPYKSWVDYAQNLKNPASIVNFIAAYGTHASITSATTLAAKRAAATLLVFGGAGEPTDRLDFLNARGIYAAGQPLALGGLNDVDLWIGGLAEKKMAFGGMLGSTFSFVFELQLENLQNGDRFYYLSRTQGLNLLNELEANSLAEMIMNNTDIGALGYAIPSDVFSVPDHVLYVSTTEQAKWGYTDPTGQDPFLDALSPLVERANANSIKYNGLDHVLIQGTNEADTIIAGGGDDSVWGRGGDDRIEAGYGVDKIHGGTGDDIITNSGTDIGEVDFLMGEEGNDVIHGGSGLALVFGNQGSDFLVAGPDGKEMFGGEGNDFMLGGDGGDFLLGNEGDDWIEGGNGFDTIAGDNSELFFNSTIIGHDVMFAGQNEQDFDAESGDDIMVQGESVMRNEGMWGYDWAIYKGHASNADADLLRPIFTTDQQDILRNRFDAVEGLSGWTGNDVLKGDHRASIFTTPDPAEPEAEPGANLAGAENTMAKHHLSQAGIDRIAGLRALLGNLVQNTPDTNPTVREAQIAFDDGNILLGGGGSDTIEGRGGDDFIDGDRWLNVRIQFVHNGTTYTTDGLSESIWRLEDYSNGAPIAGRVSAFAGQTLEQLTFSRTVNPGALNIVREVVDGGRQGDVDTAVFWDNFANYEVTQNADGSVTVSHITQTAGNNTPSDGTDLLRNIERLQFADRTITVTPPSIALDGFNSTTGTAADNFETRSATNNNGSVAFKSGWVETNDGSNTIDTGAIQIDQGNQGGSNVLRFSPGTPNGATITRTLDLAGATSAVVTFTVSDQNVGGNDNEQLRFRFAADGVNFVTIESFDGGNGGTRSFTLPTNPPFTANAAIRFEMSNVLDQDERFDVDSLSVAITRTQPVTPAVRDITSNFTEGQAAISVGSLPLITDDGTTIASARVVLTNASAGDIMAVGNLPAGITGAVTTVGATIVVALTGTASLAAYQAAIQAVTYQNNSQNPSATPRRIEVTVNDGTWNSQPAVHTVTVVPVNDAPVAGDDLIRTNVNGTFSLPDWVLLANDTDLEGNALTVTGVQSGGGNGFTVSHPNGATATAINYTSTADRSFTYTVSDGLLNAAGDVDIDKTTNQNITGNNTNEIIVANNLASSINAGGGNDIIFTGAGNDTVNGGGGDDIMVWNVGDGRDRFDGDGNATAAGDLIRIEGDSSVENFVVYTAAAATAAGYGTFANGTQIVIVRNNQVILELLEVEEILINTGPGPDGVFAGNANTVAVVGNFAGTSLNFNTITIDGSEGNDTVNIANLASAHRIVFRANGGNDTIVGTLRPQDVITLPAGSDPASYTRSYNSQTGLSTLTDGVNSIVFSGNIDPLLDGGPFVQPVRGGFTFTQRDIDGLQRIIDGQRPFADDDDADHALGVRDISGAGNNQGHGNYGNADEMFLRLTEARYGELDTSIGNRALNPIFDGLDPRAISNLLGAQEADLSKAAGGANIFLMTFGQYFDHGLSFIPKTAANGTVQIGAAGNGAPGSGNPADLTRGQVIGFDEDGVPLHRNTTTAFVDQNQAYGSHVLVTQLLRQGDGHGGLTGYLLRGADDPSATGHSLLPTLREAIQHHWANNTMFTFENGSQISFRTYFTNYPVAEGVTGDLIGPDGAFDPQVLSKFISNFMGSGQSLLLDTNPYIDVLDHYLGGDGRTNENYGLTAMHTIWARNHNFHAENLLAAGFEGTAQELFEAAKIINEAEYQRVVFTEFADALIGGIQGDGDHGFDGYNPNADAGISHEFAAAVYRFGHSMIGQTLTVLDENGQPKQVALFDAFLNPSNDSDVFTLPVQQLNQHGYFPQPGYAQLGVNAILGGQVLQASEEVDFNIVDAVRNDLVRINADLFSFNVARGRDVGLGTLNQIKADLAASTDPYVKFAVDFLRQAGVNVNPYSSWADFQARNGLSNAVIAQFMTAYPDLTLTNAQEIADFIEINGNIGTQTAGSYVVKGVDRVDLWVGGLAESHVNGGMVGSTFWIVMHEQFDRLQEADRFYYVDRLEAFDFYESFIDGQEFSDIVARNTGMNGLPEDIFSVDDEDGDDGDGDNDDDDDDEDDDDAGNGDDDDDEDDEDDDDDQPDGGGDDGDPDDDEDDDGEDDDDDDGGSDDDDDDDGDGDGGTTPLPVAARTLIGTATGEALLGAAGNDMVLAGAGGDILSGEDGDDILRGEDGDDILSGGNGADVMSGGAGADELHGGGGADLLFGDAGNDRIFGDAGNDVIEGGAGADQVWAGDGNDTILAAKDDGDDTYWGGEGTDTLDYSAATANLTVDLGNGFSGRGSVSGGSTGSDIHYGFENFIGGSGHDVITATAVANIIDGGLGEDTFRFTSAANANGDRVYGFTPGDKIDFSAIDANTGVAGVQHFTLKAGAITAAGDIVATHEVIDGEAFTVLRGNIDGDPDADFELLISGTHNLRATDFNGVS